MTGNNTAGPKAGPAREWSDLPEWITTQEAAEISGYHPEYVRRLARQGKIGAVKKGRDWWIDPNALQSYLEVVAALGSKKFDPRRPVLSPESDTG